MTVTLDPGDMQTSHPNLIEIMGYLGLIGSSSDWVTGGKVIKALMDELSYELSRKYTEHATLQQLYTLKDLNSLTDLNFKVFCSKC